MIQATFLAKCLAIIGNAKASSIFAKFRRDPDKTLASGKVIKGAIASKEDAERSRREIIEAATAAAPKLVAELSPLQSANPTRLEKDAAKHGYTLPHDEPKAESLPPPPARASAIAPAAASPRSRLAAITDAQVQARVAHTAADAPKRSEARPALKPSALSPHSRLAATINKQLDTPAQ